MKQQIVQLQQRNSVCEQAFSCINKKYILIV